MADDQDVRQAISIDLGDDGVAASNPGEVEFPRRVAPTFKGQPEHNTIKPFLVVVGCCSLPHVQFDFDSSFVLPAARKSFRRLAKLRDDLSEPAPVPTPANPTPTAGRQPPLAIFGHADPVGTPQHNSPLSARRALAAYAVLIRNVAIFESFFTGAMAPEVWGKRQQDAMEAEVGKRPTRRALIEAYMDSICVRDVGSGLVPYRLDPAKDFLGGADDKTGHRVNVQGCGEFNPTLILSKKRERDLDKADPSHGLRNAANRINRRVIAFLFKPGSRIRPAKWPCPAVRNPDPISVCRKRLWSDELKSQKRTAQPAENDREFKKTQDTFGCRFYHGIAGNSPCEGIHKQWVLRVLLEPPRPDREPLALKNRDFRVTVGDAPGSPVLRGKTDSEGILRIPVFDEHVTMQLKLDVAELLLPQGAQGKKDKPDAEDEKSFASFELAGGELRFLGDGSLPDAPGSGSREMERLAAKQRLFNLGYGRDELEKWTEDDLKIALRQFQERELLKVRDGTLTDETKDQLREEHEPRVVRPSDDDTAKAPASRPGAVSR